MVVLLECCSLGNSLECQKRRDLAQLYKTAQSCGEDCSPTADAELSNTDYYYNGGGEYLLTAEIYRGKVKTRFGNLTKRNIVIWGYQNYPRAQQTDSMRVIDWTKLIHIVSVKMEFVKTTNCSS